MITMSAEEQIQELRAEVAHADDLVERLLTENEELRAQLELERAYPMNSLPATHVTA